MAATVAKGAAGYLIANQELQRTASLVQRLYQSFAVVTTCHQAAAIVSPCSGIPAQRCKTQGGADGSDGGATVARCTPWHRPLAGLMCEARCIACFSPCRSARGSVYAHEADPGPPGRPLARTRCPAGAGRHRGVLQDSVVVRFHGAGTMERPGHARAPVREHQR